MAVKGSSQPWAGEAETPLERAFQGVTVPLPCLLGVYEGKVLAGKEGVEKLGLRGGKWRWWLDNQVALAYVRRGGGRVEVLEKLVEEIWDGLWEMGVEIVGEGYIPSERMEADEGSREVDRGAWRTREWVREWAREIVGECDVDVFAGEGNAVCRRFLSRWECRGSEGVNGLVKEWGERNWVVPPLSLLRVTDLEHVSSIGTASGLLAVLVLGSAGGFVYSV
jgi:hypothetical protein